MSNESLAHVQPPAKWLALTELPRAAMEAMAFPLAAPILLSAPTGDGHPVLFLPGFVATDRSTTVMRLFLANRGYSTHSWDLGRNMGPRAIGLNSEKLLARITAIQRASGRKVSLVGWSLGGVMARQMAHLAPDLIRQVIMLASPFKGDPRSTHAWPAYRMLTGQTADAPHVQEISRLATLPSPVPLTAIYSRDDGVAAWETCCDTAGPQTENVEVGGSHCGMGVNPAALFVIADRLAQAEGAWTPIDRSSLPICLFPKGVH